MQKKRLAILFGIGSILCAGLYIKKSMHAQEGEQSSTPFDFRSMSPEVLKKALSIKPFEEKKRELPELSPQELAAKSSPTENYLKVVGWDTVQNKLDLSDKKIADMKVFVSGQIIPEEKRHADNYYVLYHAMERWFWVLFELQRDLYALAKGYKPSHTFLRSPGEYHEMQESVDEFLVRNDNIINDHLKHMKRILLSTNFTFPGHLKEGESSFYYFLESQSIAPPNIQAILYGVVHSLFKDFDLTISDEQYLNTIISQLADISEKLSRDEQARYGLLLQIFLPKDKVGESVYLSKEKGRPKNESKQAERIKTIFEQLRTSPEKLELGKLQARILLHSDLFSRPESGVEIFEYNFISDNRLEQYKTIIDRLAKMIFLFGIEKMSDAILARHGVEREEEISVDAEKTAQYEKLRLANIEYRIESGLPVSKEDILPLITQGMKDKDMFGALELAGKAADKALLSKEDVLPLITQGMKDKDMFGALELAGKAADKALLSKEDVLPLITQGMKDEESFVRKSALALAGKAFDKGLLSKENILLLITQGMKDENWDIRESALKLAGKAVDKDLLSKEDILLLITQVMKDENAPVRMTALELADKGVDKGLLSKEGILPLITQGIKDKDRNVRESALELAYIAVDKDLLSKENILLLITQGMKDEDASVRATALKLMNKIRIQEEQERAFKAFDFAE